MSKNYERVQKPEDIDHKAFRETLHREFAAAGDGCKGGRITRIMDDMRADPGTMVVTTAGNVTPAQRKVLERYCH